MFNFSEKSKEMLKNVHPDLVELMGEVLTLSPHDFRITSGARTAEQQKALYNQGRTTKGPRVTNCDGYNKKSNHQIKADGYGHAVDIFICGEMREGKYVKFTTEEGYSVKRLEEIAKLFKALANKKGLKVEWGGDWKMKDTPHFEIK